MASPRVVYGFMHEIITSRINSPAFRQTPVPKGRHQSGALQYASSYRVYRVRHQVTGHESDSAVDTLLVAVEALIALPADAAS